MSIINEALKKTEEHLQKNTVKDNNTPLSDKPSGPKPFLLYTLILLAGLLLGNFIFTLLKHLPQGNGLASNSQSHKPQGNGLASNSQSHKPQGNGLASDSTQVLGLPSFRQSQAESHKSQDNGLASNSQSHKSQDNGLASPLPILTSQPPEEKKPAEANFVLNGIFFSDNNGYALVNNQIVKENDYVDGARVNLITANSLELNNAGQTITLTTRK